MAVCATAAAAFAELAEIRTVKKRKILAEHAHKFMSLPDPNNFNLTFLTVKKHHQTLGICCIITPRQTILPFSIFYVVLFCEAH